MNYVNEKISICNVNVDVESVQNVTTKQISYIEDRDVYEVSIQDPTAEQNSLCCQHGVLTKCTECMSAYKQFQTKLKKHRGFKAAHINIHSLYPKIDEVQFLLCNSNLDILCLSETWLDQSLAQELHINGYSLIRKDRNRHGGGVAIYIKNGLDYCHRPELNSEIVESVWIEIKVAKGHPLLVCCMYRPPSATSEYFNEVLDEIERATSEDKEIMLLGDLNYNYKIDENLSNNPIHYIENLFLLSQMIDKPTRVTTSSSTLIDVILSSVPNKHLISDTAKISLSDHYLIYTCVDISIENKGHKTIQFRDYKKFDINSFKEELKTSAILVSLPISNDVNHEWTRWKTEFLRICDKHAPIKVSRVRSRHNPWMTHDIIKLIYKRDYIHEKAVQGSDQQLFNTYREIRNLVNTKIEEAKREYFNKVASDYKKDPKKTWKEINKVASGNKHDSEIPSSMDCNELNEYFVSIGKKVAETLPTKNELPWLNPECMYRFLFKSVASADVLKHLLSLGEESNLDILGIDSKLLYIGATILEPYLTNLINMSIATSYIPDDWKIARVTPIYKGKGCIKNKTNYRPISVICHIAKVIEREVQIQFIEYLTSHELISPDQFAFLKFHSTQTCLHRIIDDWYEAINEQELIGVTFLDIQKCFDTIDHTILFKKLHRYGVCDKELEWFKNYLSHRKQAVYCNNNLSSFLPVDVGVPQGSILGPILFLVFINDLSQHVKLGSCNMYADDVSLYVTGKTTKEVKEGLQGIINDVYKWYIANKLSINIAKSNTMLVGTKQNVSKSQEVLNACINDEQLEQVSSARYLGIHIDDTLSWNSQVQSICKSVSFKLSKLKRLNKFVSSDLLNTIYLTSIQPTLDYGCTVWGTCSQANKDMIMWLRKRAARIVTNRFDYINDRGMLILKDLGWQTLDERRDYFLANLMFKCIHGMAPHWLTNQILMACESHDRTTRAAISMDVIVPQPRLEVFRNSFQYSGAKVWNNLPDHIKETSTLGSFKYLYKKHHFKKRCLD